MLFFFQIFSLCCLLVVFTSPTHTYNDLMTETHITDIEFEDSFDLYIQTNTGLSYLTYLLTHSDLYGKWYNQEKLKGHFLQSQSGFSHMFPLKNDTTLKMCLYSGIVKHSESSCLKILNTTTLLQDSIFDYETMTITLPDIAVHIEEYRGDETIERDCLVDYTFKFASRKGDDLFDPSYDLDIDKENLAILFQIHNSNCSIDLASRLLFPRYTSLSLANVLDYLIDIILIGFTVQLLASRWVSENLLKASKQISLGKLLMIQAFDFYVAFQYWLGETSKLKPAKSIPAPSIMMILAFMASMIHAVAQRQKRLDQPAYCHVRWLNYSLWVIIPGGALTASLVWKEHRAILLVGCLYEIPQIIQNFLTQTKYSFDFSIFFFLVLPKAIYIGWILAFADIILGFNCDKEINLFCCLIILEIAVVIIQTQRPKLWIKIKSPYKMRSHCKIEDMEEVCAICLEANLPVINESHYWCFGKNLNDAEMIVTPCNHQFHQRCLKIWMKRNLSCPYCRCDLPSLP